MYKFIWSVKTAYAFPDCTPTILLQTTIADMYNKACTAAGLSGGRVW